MNNSFLQHPTQPLQDLTNQPLTGHQVLRNFACQNLEIYANKMTTAMIAKSKHKLEYEVGELVKILIPKIDRFGADRPCKILEKLNYNDTFKYLLGCKSGILNNFYCAGELDPLGVKGYPELDHISEDCISVRETTRSQSIPINVITKNLVLNVEVDVIVVKCVTTKFKINICIK